MRDSVMTGAGYGKFDMEWLLNVIVVGSVNDKIEIGLNLKKGLNIAEDFIMARYYMYKNVYYHKTTRSAEIIVRKILERVKILLGKRGAKKLEVPEAVRRMLLEQDNLEVPDYLEIDDYMLWYCFARWARDGHDEILQNLCRCLLNRRLLKSVDIREFENYSDVIEKIQALKAKAVEKGEEYAFLIDLDEPSTKFYKDSYIYSGRKRDEPSNDNEVSEQIFLFDEGGKGYELSTVSEIVNTIRNKSMRLARIYFPEELSREAESILGVQKK